MAVSLIALFGAGLATFFTPCVLPLIPIYLAAIAGTASASRGGGTRLFVRALAFSIGLVLVFSLLGAAAAALGGILKSNEAYLLLFGGVLVLLFGLKFVGLIQIPLLDRVVRLDEERFSSRIGLLNAFVMGFVFGAGWSPCVGPLLGTALTVAAAQGTSALAGMGLLAIYGLGFVLPFLVVALFAERLIPLVRRVQQGLPLFEKTIGVLLLAGAGYLLVSAVTPPAARPVEQASSPAVQAVARDHFPLPDGLPALVEFYRPDCPVCQRMEPVVQRIFERCDGNKVTLRKVDLSRPENRQYITTYRILGVPTFILFDTERNEVARLIGAQSEEAIYQAIATLRGEQCDGVGPLSPSPEPLAPGSACTGK